MAFINHVKSFYRLCVSSKPLEYPCSADLFRNSPTLCSNSRNLGVNWSSRYLSSEAGRESIEYDVLIVGAGPAGLSAAIRFKQLCQEKNTNLSVCLVEKGAEVGAHIISGNVFEPLALDELLPHWRQEQAPIEIPASSYKFWFLTKDRAIQLPSPFDNKGNYVISLSQLVRWLGGKAEELGAEIYPGFSASEVLYDASDKIVGIATKDMGISKDGSKKENFQPGIDIKGRFVLEISWGARCEPSIVGHKSPFMK